MKLRTLWEFSEDEAQSKIGKDLGLEASSYVTWVRFGVRNLDYLKDLDEMSQPLSTIIGHTPQMIDYAHGHWAPITAITTVDRCAAALGVKVPKKNPHDLRSIKEHIGKGSLSENAEIWINSVLNDPEYNFLLNFRNPLTHRAIRATATIGGRSELIVETNGKLDSIPVNQLVNRSFDFAHEHVGKFLKIGLEQGY
jgi:hypothetical protein